MAGRHTRLESEHLLDVDFVPAAEGGLATSRQNGQSAKGAPPAGLVLLHAFPPDELQLAGNDIAVELTEEISKKCAPAPPDPADVEDVHFPIGVRRRQALVSEA